jgi:hypothetical protein
MFWAKGIKGSALVFFRDGHFQNSTTIESLVAVLFLSSAFLVLSKSTGFVEQIERRPS